MNRSIKKIIVVASLIFCMFGYTSRTEALSLYAEKQIGVLQKGDTVLVKIFVESKDQEINALEGVVRIDGDVQVDTISTGGSLFTLWPLYPVYKKVGTHGEISFTGGTLSSAYGSKLQVFTLALTPLTEGEVSVSFPKVMAYKADGKGTLVSGNVGETLSMTAVKKTTETRNDLKDFLESDTKGPQKFNIEYARDVAAYDGQVFISFTAIDNESGVVRYEVEEEGQVTAVEGNTYVLKNQKLAGKVTVTAFDAKGNSRSESIEFGSSGKLLYIVLGILLIVTVFGVYFWFKKNNEAI